MTEGQQQALEELQQIAAASDGTIEILKSIKPTEEGKSLVVALSIFCGSDNIPRKLEGIPLRAREQFLIGIPPGFPFVVPKVRTLHNRFAGYPHVQWGSYPCLYLAPNTEWDPNDGMFGFIKRFDEWIQQAALDQLDPDGAPIHPPAGYPTNNKLVIVHADTPQVADSPWLGIVHLKKITDTRIDLVDWLPLSSEQNPEIIGAAVLLSQPLPFSEYPSKVSDLITVLEQKGVSKKTLLTILQIAVVNLPEDSPVYVVIGTPMRGLRGIDESLRQHLTVWSINSTVAETLRLSLNKFSENEKIQEIGEKAEELMLKWAAGADIDWCKVYEQRPETTIRRDQDSSLSWFQNKKVSIWGCGALGSRVAENLVRAGTKTIILRDNKKVTPGILVRQFFDDKDIGKYKSQALANKLRDINPDIEVETSNQDILDEVLSTKQWSDDADIIIDTTASKAVLEKAELCWHLYDGARKPIASLVIDHIAQSGLIVLAKAEHSGGPLDVLRRAKMEIINHKDLSHYKDKFWPDSMQRQERMFQPEPGCSDATFIGSAADAGALAGLMLNQLSQDLKNESSKEASAHFITQPQSLLSNTDKNYSRFEWVSDQTISESNHKYDVRISDEAWDSIAGWIQKNARRNGEDVETGGLLFGEIDKAARVIWIIEASGPPLDSRASEFGFICGIHGTTKLNAKIRKKTDGAAYFVGMWHTHPNNRPAPSPTDISGMKSIVSSMDNSPYEALLLIVGNAFYDYEIASYLYTAGDFSRHSYDSELSGRFYTVYNPGYILFARAWNGTQNILGQFFLSMKNIFDKFHDKYKDN